MKYLKPLLSTALLLLFLIAGLPAMAMQPDTIGMTPTVYTPDLGCQAPGTALAGAADFSTASNPDTAAGIDLANAMFHVEHAPPLFVSVNAGLSVQGGQTPSWAGATRHPPNLSPARAP